MKSLNVFTLVLMTLVCHSKEQSSCCRDTVHECYPRPELNTDQIEILRDVVEELEQLPCEEMIERIYNTVESPITYTAEQIDYLVGRYPSRFEAVPTEETDCRTTTVVPECPDEPIPEPIPDVGSRSSYPHKKRRRRANRPGTGVCETILDGFTTPHLALNRRGEIVLVVQGMDITGADGVRFANNQYVYETICGRDQCEGGLQCNCTTVLTPSTTAVVHYINGENNFFIEEPIQARTCHAYVP
ncbi:uncharacterized protein LOC117122856 [Anneissia japonica]|uniref:uncharacterized protein LOC117122856 n=1 Tax=Anneissia japonica TaxID=1529436 RepID=UPI0014255A60|nr:uncharacterized protein LOC117122856 [Anneissia japonica]